MNEEGLKLTTYFGERDRAGAGFLADAFSEIYARHALQTSLVIRGAEGFGRRHHLHTDRQLTLSEDLPIVSVAVDAHPRVEAALEEVARLRFDGLVTLERARLLTGDLEAPVALGEEAKLTVYVGRQERAGARPAHEAVVALLHARGIAGATVVLGVDGTAHGDRARARFFSANARVPLMIVAVGDGARIAAVLPELGTLLERPLVTLEGIRVCKRDGARLAEPRDHADGLGKLMVYAGEQARHEGRPLSASLLRALRAAGAAGATSLRGVWGYHGDHRPHGDSFWQLRRRVPVVTVLVDTPERIRRWYAIADEHTGETGLVTHEIVRAPYWFAGTG